MGKVLSINGNFMTVAPISHTAPIRQGQEGSSKKNESPFRKLKIPYNGTASLIPIISGNGFRGMMRKALAYDLLDLIGLSEEELARSNREAYYFLMAGGALGKSESKIPGLFHQVLKSREYLRSVLPSCSLLGGTVLDGWIEGRIDVGFMYPVCVETKDMLDIEDFDALPSAADLTDWIGYAKHDTMRSLIDEKRTDEVIALEKSKKANKSKGAKNTSDSAEGSDEVAAEGESDPNRQMPYNIEVLVPGVELVQTIGFHIAATELEKSAAVRALDIFEKRPVVGMKGSAGHGRVKANIDRQGLSGDQYCEHILQKKDEIKDFLLVKLRKSLTNATEG